MLMNAVLEQPEEYTMVDYDGLWKKLIYELFEEFVLFFALLTDISGNSRLNQNYRSFYGTSLTYEYNLYKFMDHNGEELIRSRNPFSTAVLAGKRRRTYVNPKMD